MTPTRFRSNGFLLLASVLVLSSCSLFGGGTGGGDASSSSSVSSVNFVPTPNVTYTGTVETMEASIYMEGTHRLSLTRGGFILLSAADQGMDLDRYIGMEVEVRGSVRPTVEGDAVHMQVTEVVVLDAMSSSAASENTDRFCGGIAGIACPAGQECVDDPSDTCDPENGGADCGGVCVPITEASSSSVAAVSSSTTITPRSSSSAPASVASSAISSSQPPANANEESIVLMASQDYSGSLWTQQYCTSHIAFCIPAHKNWYYKSFGATTNNLWHVEFDMQSVENLNQGPIVLNLVDSTVEAAGGVDGRLQTHGSQVIGYKAWTDDTHFELIADARLSAAVSYMLARITPYNPEE